MNLDYFYYKFQLILTIIFSACTYIHLQAIIGAAEPLIVLRENIVKDLASQAQQAYSQRCGNTGCDDCSYNACSSDLPPFQCVWNVSSIGCNNSALNQSECRLMSLSSSGVKIPPHSVSGSQAVKNDVCAFNGIDDQFIKIANDDPNIIASFVGGTSGVYRFFPGTEMCQDYDAQQQSWFAQAQSGPKNVIMILGRAMSMAVDDTISTLREGAAAVVSMLSYQDTLQIVTLNEKAKSLVPQGQKTGNEMLFFCDSVHKIAAQKAVSQISPSGGMAWDEGFKEAYRLFENTKTAGPVNIGQNIIIFVVDTTAYQESIFDTINTLDADWKATIFTYSIGPLNTEEGKGVMRRISCEHGGVFSNIEKLADLAPTMEKFSQYIARMQQTQIVKWSEPFNDTSGLGLMVTASYPIFDQGTEPKHVVGVAGIIVNFTNFTSIDTNETVIANLQARSSIGSLVGPITECTLEAMRGDMNCGTCQSGLQDAKNKVNPPACDVTKENVFCGGQGNITKTLITMASFSHCCNIDICAYEAPCTSKRYYYTLPVSVILVVGVLLIMLLYALLRYKIRGCRERAYMADYYQNSQQTLRRPSNYKRQQSEFKSRQQTEQDNEDYD